MVRECGDAKVQSEGAKVWSEGAKVWREGLARRSGAKVWSEGVKVWSEGVKVRSGAVPLKKLKSGYYPPADSRTIAPTSGPSYWTVAQSHLRARRTADIYFELRSH